MNLTNCYQIDIPVSFTSADEIEIQKYFGESEDVKGLYVDNEHHAMIVCSMPKEVDESYNLGEEIIAIKNAIKKDVNQCSILGLYKRHLDKGELYLVQYTYKIGTRNMYSVSAFFIADRHYYNVNCVCRSNMYSKMNECFMDVIDSIRV